MIIKLFNIYEINHLLFYANATAGNLSFENMVVTKDIPSKGLDSAKITVIDVVFIIGGVALIAGIYISMKKRATPEYFLIFSIHFLIIY